MSWITTPGTVPMSRSLSVFDDYSNSTEDDSYYDPECDYLFPTLAETIILCFVYSAIGLTGFVGNFLVVYTIFVKKGPQSVTSLLLCSLAVSDIIVVTIYLPMKVADIVTTSWVLGPVACKLIGYLNLISPACSACMLMVIGLERFIVILYPLKARSLITRLRAKFIVAGTWIVSFILGVPGLLFQNQNKIDMTEEFICTKDYMDDVRFRRGYPLYGFTILYVIPLTVMGFAYTTVCMRLYASTKTSRGLQSMKAPAKSSGSTGGRSNINGTGSSSSTTNIVPVDDDPFSAGSETRIDGPAGGRVVSPSAPRQTRRPRQSRRSVSLRDRQQVIIMLILVVVLYAVTWGPLLIVSVVHAFGGLNHYCRNVLNQISAACHVLTFLNSSINPIVYSFMSKNFRETVREALRSCCRCLVSCGGGKNRRDSMYNNSRYSTTTMVTQAYSVRRGRSSSDGNCSPSRAGSQSIELTQYTRLPSVEPAV